MAKREMTTAKPKRANEINKDKPETVTLTGTLTPEPAVTPPAASGLATTERLVIKSKAALVLTIKVTN